MDDSKVYDVVEQMPSFPGGPQNLMNYLSSHINYPAIALENGIITGKRSGRLLLKKD